MNATVLFDVPQKEISSLINSRLLACQNASIVAGFLTPSGVQALASSCSHQDSLTVGQAGVGTCPKCSALVCERN